MYLRFNSANTLSPRNADAACAPDADTPPSRSLAYRLVVSIMTAALLLAPACSVFATDSIKIAIIGAKTGDAATSGYSTYFETIRFAAAEINGTGGLLGRQVALLALDNQSTPLGSRQAAAQAVSAGVVAAVGALWSSHALAMAHVFQENKIPMVAAGATNPVVTQVGDCIFRVCYTDDFQGVVLGNFIRNDLSARTAAVAFQAGDTYSIGLAASFADHYTKLGGHVVFMDSYAKAATDFSAIIDRLLILKPQAVVLPGYAREAGFFIKQARTRGLEAVFAGGDGWEIQMLAYGGVAVEGSFMIDHWHPGSTNPKSRVFLAAFEASPFHTAAGVDTAAALAYDAFCLIVDAVKRAGSDDPALIREALKQTDAFVGVTGTINFDAERNPVKSAVILRFGQGRIEYLKTIDP